ncbi:hypothetical protein ACTHPF_20465 [Paenibacillus sp. SAF-054]|uniref:hypothetical protein n=1 Tax=unclassified Paenibacillus TaxID=185978 RepID=UPI003F7D6E63
MLLAAERTEEQGELWPSITEIDKLKTRKLLEEYMKNKQMVMAFSQKANLPDQMRKVYETKKEEIENIELAFNLIQDTEVKRIVEHRFFKLRRYKDTVIFYRGSMSESTVDRYIDKGISAVADSLKLWGIL